MRSPRATNGHLSGFRSACGARRRGGYSLIEAMVASVLSAFLGLLLAMSCASFGRSAVEVDSRARITQEGILAAQSLACDLGGFMADAVGRTGTLAKYSFSSWDYSEGTVLILYYHRATGIEVVTYSLNGNQLVRSNVSSGVTTPIAHYVSAFSVAANPENSSQAVITITVTYRNFKSTFTLISTGPP